MNKQETYQYLKDHNIPFEITEHPAVYNMEELDSVALRPLSFASPDDLKKYMDLTPGAVTPLGLLNVKGTPITLYLDAEFKGKIIGIHPNENTATVWMQGDDLVALLRGNGCEVEIVEI